MVKVDRKPIKIAITETEDKSAYNIDTPFYVMSDVPKERLEWIVGPFAGIPYTLELEGLDKETEETVRKMAVDFSTWRQYLEEKEIRYENYFTNLQSLNDNCYSVKTLEEVAKGKSILFVGGGSSTTDNLDEIRRVIDSNSAIVIAGGTGIRLLAQNNIKPHFALAFDGYVTEWSNVFKQVDQEKTEDVPLICYLSLNTKCFNYWKGPKIIIGGQESFIDKTGIDDLPHISEGGSGVSTAMLFLAEYMNAEKLYMIGVDLCYQERDGKLYSHGNTVSDNLYNVIEMKDPITEESRKTTQVFVKEYHFLTRRKLKATKLYNCSKIGFNITGFEAADLSDIKDRGTSIKLSNKIKRTEKKRIKENLKKLKKEFTAIMSAGINHATRATQAYNSIFMPYDAIQKYRETWTRRYDQGHIKFLAGTLASKIND